MHSFDFSARCWDFLCVVNPNVQFEYYQYILAPRLRYIKNYYKGHNAYDPIWALGENERPYRYLLKITNSARGIILKLISELEWTKYIKVDIIL